MEEYTNRSIIGGTLHSEGYVSLSNRDSAYRSTIGATEESICCMSKCGSTLSRDIIDPVGMCYKKSNDTQ